jgi:glycosyltransferase involved in cell wall biosynthesis
LHVRMGFSSHLNEVGHVRLSKIFHIFSIIARIFYFRLIYGVRILYYPPSGPDRVPMFRDFAVLLLTRWLFDKTVFHFRAGGISELYERLPAWQRWLYRKAYFGADAAVRLSEFNPEDGKRLKAKKEYVIPNGLDDPFPGFVVTPPISEFVDGAAMRILYVGVLRESKGIMDLINACGMLLCRGIPFELELMGQWKSDAFERDVAQRIVELNIVDHVRFLGEKTGEQKYSAYRSADVLCFPTYFNCETFGNVLVEAMACGLPVVATRWRGVPSIVEEDVNGFLVNIRDAPALADRLAVLGSDPELRYRMGVAGRVKFEREYLYAKHAGRMRRMLLETAGVLTDQERELPIGAQRSITLSTP